MLALVLVRGRHMYVSAVQRGEDPDCICVPCMCNVESSWVHASFRSFPTACWGGVEALLHVYGWDIVSSLVP